MKEMHRIYVAGPMTPKGDGNHAIEYLMNVNAGIRLATELMLDGFSVFCPMLDLQYFLSLHPGEKIPADIIRGNSMTFVEHWAQAVLVRPNWEGSTGTHDEIMRAQKANVPVFFDKEDLKKYFSVRDSFDNMGEVTTECKKGA